MRGARYVSFERNRSPEARLGLAWIVGKHGLCEPTKFFCFVFFLFFSFFNFGFFHFVFTSSFTLYVSEL